MLIANTDIEAKQLINLYDADPGRVEVVHPASTSTCSARRPGRRRAAARPARRRRRAAFAGRIQPLKAPDVLLRAVGRLLERDPAPAPGSSSRSSAAPPAAASSTPSRWPSSPPSSASTTWSGSCRRSRRPSWPTGTPRRPGRRAVVQRVVRPGRRRGPGHRHPGRRRRRRRADHRRRDGHSGLLVDGHEPRDWAAALRRVIDDHDLRVTAARARSSRPAQFSWELTAERTLEVYRARPPRAMRAPVTRTPARRAEVVRELPRRQRDRVRRRSPTASSRSPARREEAPDPRPARRRPARARRPRLRLPQARREPRAGLPLAARAQPADVRRRLRRRPARRHLPRRPAAARRGDPRRARPAARLGADLRRRVVQHDPRARLRLLDPQGVGVAQLRGESTANLEAFRGWLEVGPTPSARD